MNVYFGTSPRIKERYPNEIKEIYNFLITLGYKHTSDFTKDVESKVFYHQSSVSLDNHHKETIKSIKKADICVFEASCHSLSVGFLVNYSLDLGKPVIVLSQDKNIPFLFESIKSERLFFVLYNKKNLALRLKEVLDKATKVIDVRFNFFITPRLLSYLDWISEKKRTPRSVYIRDLIEKDMAGNKDYSK